MTTLNEDLIYEILSAVEEIPAGKVLSISDYYGEYSCHRVVNHAGRLAPHFTAQRERLLEEGVTFKDRNHVDMKECQWDC